MSRKPSFSLMVLAALMLFVLSSMVPQLLHSQSSAAAAEKDVEYTCPMHPEVKSKTPGTCPKCNMNLVVMEHHAAPPAKPSRWGADYFPNVPLITQDGKTVHFYDDLLKGKIVAIDLIYTNCKDSCPLETARLAQVQRMLGDRVGKDILFYSISIDPEHDTPAVLKEYAQKFHVAPGWTFLTGTQENIDLISKKLGLYTPYWNRDGHAPMLMIGNVATGQWMQESAMDNARFLAIQIEQFVDTWASRKPAPTKTYESAPTLAISSPGQYLFGSRCIVCHTMGQGESLGPDLQGVTNRRDRRWLAKFIATPDEMLAKGDPVATALKDKYKNMQMPNLRLSPEDVEALIDYLQSRSAAGQAGGTARARQAEPSAQR